MKKILFLLVLSVGLLANAGVASAIACSCNDGVACVVDTVCELSGAHNYPSLEVTDTGQIRIPLGASLDITTTGDIVLNGLINGNGEAGTRDVPNDGDCTPGYNARPITLTAPSIYGTGSISANGGRGTRCDNNNCRGAGHAANINITTDSLSLSGSVSAVGGNGYNACCSICLGGRGGNIDIFGYSKTSAELVETNGINANGGTKGDQGRSNPGNINIITNNLSVPFIYSTGASTTCMDGPNGGNIFVRTNYLTLTASNSFTVASNGGTSGGCGGCGSCNAGDAGRGGTVKIYYGAIKNMDYFSNIAITASPGGTDMFIPVGIDDSLGGDGGANPPVQTLINLQGFVKDKLTGFPLVSGSIELKIIEDTTTIWGPYNYDGLISNGILKHDIGSINALSLVPNKIYTMNVTVSDQNPYNCPRCNTFSFEFAG